MDRVRVEKHSLLTTLKENREKHKKIVEAAYASYREEAIKLLDTQLAAAQSGKRRLRWEILEEPVDMSREYDRVIRMIEMSVESEITLSEQDFRQYVMDDWSWKRQFSLSNMKYLSGKPEYRMLDAEEE